MSKLKRVELVVMSKELEDTDGHIGLGGHD